MLIHKKMAIHDCLDHGFSCLMSPDSEAWHWLAQMIGCKVSGYNHEEQEYWNPDIVKQYHTQMSEMLCHPAQPPGSAITDAHLLVMLLMNPPSEAQDTVCKKPLR